MSDHILEEHLAAKLGLSPEELHSFEVQGVIHCKIKNGNRYYSSRDFYRLKGILHHMRNKGLSLQDARAKVGLATTTAN